MEGQKSVAFLGPRDSYSYQAAVQYFGLEGHNLLPQQTFKNVFTAVQNLKAWRGVVPFENSSQGPVSYTLDLLANHQEISPDVIVCDEHYLPVHHSLVGNRANLECFADLSKQPHPQANGDPQHDKPLDFSKIRHIYSHPQALGQCKGFLSKHLGHAEQHEVVSTSRAAELVAEDKSGTAAAITSRAAAELNKLDILASRIEDREDNTTRFFVLKRRTSENNVEEQGVTVDSERKSIKSLINFTIDHEKPGALADALLVFKPFDLNLTSIFPRPSGLQAWHYVFLLEIRASHLDNPRLAIEEALKALSRVTKLTRWLGTWNDRKESA